METNNNLNASENVTTNEDMNNTDTPKVQKPLSMVLSEFKNQIVYDINSATTIPLCIKEMILKDIYLELVQTNAIQSKKDIDEYSKLLCIQESEK